MPTSNLDLSLDHFTFAGEHDADLARLLFKLAGNAEREKLFDDLLKRHLEVIATRPAAQADTSLTQTQAAFLLARFGINVSVATISCWERGLRTPVGWPSLAKRSDLEAWARTNAGRPHVWRKRRGPKPSARQLAFNF